jgi:hypothetical protein
VWLLWRNVYSDLPIFNLVIWFFCYLVLWVPYIFSLLTSYQIYGCKYLFHRLLFNFVNIKGFFLVYFCFFLFIFAFGATSERIIAKMNIKELFPIFSPRIFMILGLISLQLILVDFCANGPTSFFYMRKSNFPNTIFVLLSIFHFFIMLWIESSIS